MRLHAVAPRRQFDGIGQARIAHVVGLGRLDEVDAAAGVGGLDVLDGVGVVGERLGVLGNDQGGVDDVGEMVGFGDDHLPGRVDLDLFQPFPAPRLLVVVVHLHIVIGLVSEQVVFCIAEGELDRLLELGAVRQKTVAGRRIGDVDHAGVELGQFRLAEGDDGDLDLPVDGALGDIQGHVPESDLLRLARRHLFLVLLATGRNVLVHLRFASVVTRTGGTLYIGEQVAVQKHGFG